uniref:Uncharacterized protein n=1 Tax=Bubo bubo TaxID=30461 RepID=A0A8C0FS99_BUBBB
FEGKARVDRHPRWKALTEERTLPPAPQRCSFPPAFALSPPACVLCGRAAADPVLCGQKIRIEDFCAHFFCLVSAPGLPPARKLRFDPNDICRTVVRAAHKPRAQERNPSPSKQLRDKSLAPSRPHSCSVCFRCRARLPVLVFSSTAPSAETSMPFSWTCSQWASESP